MKTLNLFLSLALLLTGSILFAADDGSGEKNALMGGFVSLEVVDGNGAVVRGEVRTAQFPDDDLPRAACCVQPEQGNLQKSPIIAAIETLATRFTEKVLFVEYGRFINVCDKRNFIAALNSLGIFEEIKKQFPTGVVLQLQKDTISPAAVACSSK